MIVLDKPKGAVDAAFGNWLAGFIDGEGCFTIRNGKGPRGESLVCEFHITLRRDDEAIVREIASRTGLGRVYYTMPGGDTRSGSNPQIRWTVTRRLELRSLVEILDAHPLRAKKARDYAYWREAVSIWSQTRTGGYRGCARKHNGWIWERMRYLRDAMRDGRTYEPTGDVLAPAETAQLELAS